MDFKIVGPRRSYKIKGVCSLGASVLIIHLVDLFPSDQNKQDLRRAAQHIRPVASPKARHPLLRQDLNTGTSKS